MLFSKKGMDEKNEKRAYSVVDTLIGPTTLLKGDIHTTGNVRIDGRFEGDVLCEGEVVVGDDGEVNGNIEANTLVIYGMVKGNINSSGLLEIMQTGKVYGDLEVQSILIQQGGEFEGKSSMKKSEKSDAITYEKGQYVVQ